MVKKLLILLFFTCSAIVSATNYYVSSSTGNDGLDGRSEANAWKTFSKVNGSTFLPGDVIQFRKGDVWRETLIIPSSGNATNFITFSSYGTGANPRILCSTKAITWTETSSGSHIWKSATSFSGNPFTSFDTEIFFEEPDGTQAWGTYKTGTTGLTSEYHWTYSSGNIFVYSATDPATNYNSVEVPQRESAINMNRKNYLHFDGIDMFYGYHSGYGYNYTHNDMYEQFGLIIENSDIGYIGAWDEALEQGYGIEVVYTDMIVRNNKIHDCGRRSIAMDLYGNGYTARNILVELNEFYNGFHTTGCDIDVGAGYNANLDSVIIRRNYFHENKSRDTDLSNLIFIQNNAVGVCTLSKIYIYSNIFKWQNGYGILMEGAQSVYIYNNTFYEKATLCPSWVACVAVQSNSHATIKNNIFYGGSSSGSVDAIDESSTYTIHDYNLFYNTTSESETHDVAAKNPLFVNAPDDLHINVTSPAIGAGVVIPVVATDFEGIAYVEPPNIGAYATPVNSGTPTYLSSVIENANPSLLSMMYNTALGNIVPAASSFTVMINLVPRAVNSVAISGARVQLTLSGAVSYGDIITVAYLKPASNPLQNPGGVEAATITAQPVTNNVSPSSPVYVSSEVQNATPTLLEMTYNQALANIIPASSAFVVMVNSVSRNVNSVAISGTKVRLTLASAIANGNTVTVAYTKPAVNPLQTGTGGLAATITAKSVTNNVSPALPAYVSSAIQNVTPAMLEITFSLSLADIIPDVSAFAVTINSAPVAVTQVSITGTKVRLTLTSPAFMGDLIMLSYTKPATMPLQTSTGGQVLTFSGKSVQNNVGQANTPPEINVTKSDTYFSGFVGEIDASGSTDINGDILSFAWHPPAGIDISSASGSKIQFLAPVIPSIQTFDCGLDVGDGKTTLTQNIPILIGPYNPGLSQAIITDIDASSYLGTDLPSNISDGDAGTFWSSNGDYQWLICKLRNKFHIDHLNLSFSKGDIGRSFFDVQVSSDSIVWDPLLTSSVSCGFSQNFQTFVSEGSVRNGYSYLKVIGHGNSLNSLNKISELQVFGNPSSSGDNLFEIGMTIYPNPASEYINIFIDEAPLGPQVIRIINVAGKIEYDRSFDSGVSYLQVPVTFPSGLYIIELICYGRILGASKFIVS